MTGVHFTSSEPSVVTIPATPGSTGDEDQLLKEDLLSYARVGEARAARDIKLQKKSLTIQDSSGLLVKPCLIALRRC